MYFTLKQSITPTYHMLIDMCLSAIHMAQSVQVLSDVTSPQRMSYVRQISIDSDTSLIHEQIL